MNIYVLIGIIGIISGILCAQADVPLAWPGKEGEPMDARAVGRISSWWKETDEKPFMKSFWMSCIGRSGTYLTMWMLAEIISHNNMMLGMLLKINTFIGVYTGLLFHACACIKPLVY